MRTIIRKLVLFLLFLPSFAIYGQEQSEEKPAKKKEEGPPLIGNFALPVSQQVTPLVSFGQLVIGKNVLQLYLTGETFWGKRTYTSIFTPAVLYGVTDDFTVYMNVPVYAGNWNGKHRSSGIGDLFFQFEYAHYTPKFRTHTNQATIVANVYFPSGDPRKDPPTGFGAPAFFMGGTFNHMTVDWYAFCSAGALYPTQRNGIKFGNQYLYQFGYERVIYASPLLIFAWMVEFDGTFSEKNLINYSINPNSGGNVIYMTPSLWFSTKRWIAQAGIGFPIIQHLNGNQQKNHYAFFFLVARNI